MSGDGVPDSRPDHSDTFVMRYGEDHPVEKGDDATRLTQRKQEVEHGSSNVGPFLAKRQSHP